MGFVGNVGDTPNTNEIEKNKMVKIEAESNPKTQNNSYNSGVNQSPQSSSGKTTTVPWGNDIKFKAAQEKNNSFILMAAYKTVLRDLLPGEEYNVHHAAGLIAGTIVNPGEVFSQNRKAGPYTIGRGFKQGPTYLGTKLATTIGGGVCKIASTLYNVTILCNLTIAERYAHGMPVPYVPYGQDATVAYGVKDFRFKNNTSFPILIWAQGIDNTLYIGFYGQKKPPKVEWHHEVIKKYKAPTIYRINSKMPSSSKKVVLEGMDGAVIKSWVTVESPDGVSTIRQLGESYYKPMHFIVEKGK